MRVHRIIPAPVSRAVYGAQVRCGGIPPHHIRTDDTPLHLAAEDWDAELVRQLLAFGTDPNSAYCPQRTGMPNWYGSCSRLALTQTVLLRPPPIAVQNFVAFLAKNTGLKMPQNLK